MATAQDHLGPQAPAEAGRTGAQGHWWEHNPGDTWISDSGLQNGERINSYGFSHPAVSAALGHQHEAPDEVGTAADWSFLKLKHGCFENRRACPCIGVASP